MRGGFKPFKANFRATDEKKIKKAVDQHSPNFLYHASICKRYIDRYISPHCTIIKHIQRKREKNEINKFK